MSCVEVRPENVDEKTRPRERERTSTEQPTADELARTRRQISRPHPAGRSVNCHFSFRPLICVGFLRIGFACAVFTCSFSFVADADQHFLPCILVCIVFETIYKEVDLTQNKVAMAEKFIGKYRFVSSENFDEFMKALGVNYLLRKIANAASPIVEFSLDRDVWTLRNVSTFRTLEISFRLGEEVDEVTPDGRNVKTVFTYENGELKQVQKAVKPGEKDSIFIRKLEGDKLITTCICGNVTSIRVLQRIS
ncbi:Fatty acid-binding -like protein 6 [Trichinella nelsoni]|uniref:Fatty acid-binding-like protein 6 n=1 Tax=Trichinella nelsoni TaxID=6336 RepID=A0A0V0S5A6_9BILA|nr:Fatty acid-binding -like protein 6 [Trichinella nelsoni]